MTEGRFMGVPDRGFWLKASMVVASLAMPILVGAYAEDARVGAGVAVFETFVGAFLLVKWLMK